ncbi:hypothetical protein D3C85_1152370 [compost metagenome]
MDHVRPRHPAQFPHDGRVWRAHLPLCRCRGAGHAGQVPLEAGGRRAFAGLGRGGQDQRQGPRFPSARPLRRDRGGPVSRVRVRRAAGARDRHAQVRLRPPGPDQAHSRGTGAGTARGPDGAEPQPGQLLRRNRAGGVSPRPHPAGHGFHQRSAAAGAAVLVHRYPAHAARRAEFS